MKKPKVIAKWTYNRKTYTVTNGNDVSKQTMSLKTFFKKVDEFHPLFFESIKNGEIKVDSLKLISCLKKNLQEGKIMGTPEGIIRRLDKVKELFQTIEHTKKEVLHNIYFSVVTNIQALFLAKNIPISSPKNIPIVLQKEKKQHTLDAKNIAFCKEIISYYKHIESNSTQKIQGTYLDELQMKLHILQKRTQGIMRR
ncbi:MAG: hypothetical protein ACMXYE_01005 [Candidatus Woesearchaeota archaeon]